MFEKNSKWNANDCRNYLKKKMAEENQKMIAEKRQMNLQGNFYKLLTGIFELLEIEENKHAILYMQGITPKKK